MCEPRGHKDMVGALLVEPISKEADIGVIYMDANRWINMCGYATIGVSMTLVNENLVKVVEPVTHLILEMAAGLIHVDVEVEDGKTKSVSFENIPSFLFEENCLVNNIHFDISYSGSFFALVDADQLDIEININNANKFKELGVNLLRQIIILIPCIIIFSSIIGLDGIFIAVPVADLSAFIITVLLLKNALKKEA